VGVLAVVVVVGLIFGRPLLARWFTPPSVAVLPIVNKTGEVDLDYLSDGLTESIIASLTQLNESGKPLRLRVIAQNTIFMFKNKEVDPLEVGRQLGTDTVLAGRMSYQAGLRIFKFEMINVADGSIIWNKEYSSGLGDNPLQQQNDIPEEVASHLRLTLTEADRNNLTRRYTHDPEAYDLYLKGRAEFRRATPSGFRNSIEWYKRALDRDQNFALAYWAMGVSFKYQGTIDERPDKEANELALEQFQKALSIDSNLATARNAISSSDADNWNWEAIEKAGPSHPDYDRYLAAMGRLEEKLESEKRRLSKNPYNPLLNFTHCGTFLALDRADEAIAQCNKTLNLVPAPDKAYFGPESPWIHLLLSLAYSIKKDHAQAIAELKTALELGESSKTLLAELGTAYALSGDSDEAIKILDQLLDRANNGEYVPSLNISHIYIAIGDKDRAFVWLNKAVDERENRIVGLTYGDIYDPLRSDPRFAELIKRTGLPR
jgi:TolB-like protein/tetratricopeptide (TPR) repeat protein